MCCVRTWQTVFHAEFVLTSRTSIESNIFIVYHHNIIISCLFFEDSNATMTVARRHWQRTIFLASLKKQSQKPSFRPVAFLIVLFFILIRFFYSPRPLSSDATLFKEQRANNKGERLFSSPGDLPADLLLSLDAVLVLGGGRPKSIDHPPVFVERRCDDAIEVVRRRIESISNENPARLKGRLHKRQDLKYHLPILCLSAGTAHLPQLLSADGLPIWESTACASYILSKINKNSKMAATNMIPPESIYVETSSYDTIGNAYFARTTHTEFNGWRKLLIVTNEFHMIRTMKIFDWIFSVPTNNDTESISFKGFLPYDLYYLESPNVGMVSEVVVARKEREASSSKSVDSLSHRYSTLRDVYEFLTQEHSLYAANRLVGRGRATAIEFKEGSVNDAVKRSYGAN